MGQCRYCHKNVLMRDVHPQCEQKRTVAWREIQRLVHDAIINEIDPAIARSQAEHLARSSFIDETSCRGLIGRGWELVLDKCMADGHLDAYEMKRLTESANGLGLTPDMMRRLGIEDKLLKFKREDEARQAEQSRQQQFLIARNQTLEALQRGQFPRYPYQTPPLPFLFGLDQWLLWLFEGVTYMEERKTRRTVRNSQSVHYRGMSAGQSVSHTEENSEIVIIGVGMVALTSKFLYYTAGTTSSRVAYNKIVSVKPYTDAIEIMKDGVTAKRQVFSGLDGNFAYALVTAIAQQGR